MPVTIREVTTEVVLEPDATATGESVSSGVDEDALVDRVARAATERVLEHLRRAWED
ncbi:MAG: hypothetical protein ACXWYO_00075 [Gaiellaceae bacterium]|jgi:hypothetical protein